MKEMFFMTRDQQRQFTAIDKLPMLIMSDKKPFINKPQRLYYFWVQLSVEFNFDPSTVKLYPEDPRFFCAEVNDGT